MLPCFQQGGFGRVLIPQGGVGVLDSYTTGLWGAYGLTRLRGNYTGSVMRIRRSSDNAEQDIGLSGSSADSAAAVSFAGAGSAFIRTLYDQTGNSRTFGQSTTANQPRIVNSGVYDGKFVFDGSNDGLSSSVTSGSQSALTFYIKGTIRAFSSLQVFLEQSVDFGANPGAIALYYDNGISRVTAYHNQSANSNTNNYTAFPNNNVHAYVFDPTQTAAAKIRQYVAGTLQTPASTPNVGTIIGSYTGYTYYLGARNGGASFPTSLDLQTLVIYTVGHDATTVAAISALL